MIDTYPPGNPKTKRAYREWGLLFKLYFARPAYATILSLAALLLMWGVPARAASDVSNNSTLSNQAVASVVASVASSQTATIISSAATGGFTGSGGFSGSGGFNSGGSGGFGGGGGNGGFGGGGSSGGTGGNGGTDGNGAKLNMNDLPPAISGRAGGTEDSPNGVWMQALWAGINRNEADLAMRGNVYNALGGVDHLFDGMYRVGLAMGYERVRLHTMYNQGTYNSDGFSLSPYGAITLSPTWTASAGGKGACPASTCAMNRQVALTP